MNTNEKTIEMIMALADAPGAAGFEDEVAALARQYAEGIGPVEEDFLRNVYIHRKENTGNRPVVMLDAHSDEVGFMVHSIKPNGTLRFVALGMWNKNTLASAKVLVRNADGKYIPGIIGSKPVHFGDQGSNISDMAIDIGAVSAQDAVENFHIRIGEPVVPAVKSEYDAEHGIIFGKAFDCRIGCAVILEALRRLEGKELPCDVVGVLAVQEELGARGCKIAVNRVKPDAAIVVEGCPADDTFSDAVSQSGLRKGTMFRHMDASIVCAPRLQRFALNLAAQRGIPVQEAVREAGGNDGAVIQSTGIGAPAIVASVPVRYIHSMNCLFALEDFETTVQMVMALLESITPEVIASL